MDGKRGSESIEGRSERLKKRNEQDRARRASEQPQKREERLRKRRERDKARRLADRERNGAKKDEERLLLSVSTAGKRQCADLSAIATVLQEKRHRLASEEEDSRATRLESLRVNFAEKMAVETEEECSARLEHMSYLQQVKLSTEVDEERAARLSHKSQQQELRLSRETSEGRTARLENMSHNRELRRSSELDEDRADRLGASAAQVGSQAETRQDRHLPMLEQHHVQARMRHFHQEIATIESPTCSTCMEKFPGMKVSVNRSECLRCTRDKHVPKLYSIGNNMHPGAVPSQLQVNNSISNSL